MKELELMLSAVCSAMWGCRTLPPAEPETWSRVCALAKSHDLSQIVLEGLANVTVPAQARELLLRHAAAAISRFYAQNAALERLSFSFDKQGIDYMPLKGAVLRGLYPSPEWRVGRDLDILVRRKDLERARAVATEVLCPVAVGEGSHDVGFKLPDGVRIELHFALFHAEDGMDDLFEDPFSAAIKEEGHRYRMSDAVLYAYHVTHMAKHFRRGGCGIRAFLDLFLLCASMQATDLAKARQMLAQVGLDRFETVVSRQSRVFFEGEQGDEDTARLARFVAENQTFGSFRSQAALLRAEKKGKLGFWRRAFPSYGVMCYLYPVLRRVPVLLPFCWILRGFRFFSKKDRARFLAATRAAAQVEAADVVEISRVYEYLKPEG